LAPKRIRKKKNKQLSIRHPNKEEEVMTYKEEEKTAYKEEEKTTSGWRHQKGLTVPRSISVCQMSTLSMSSGDGQKGQTGIRP
jgi:hypothetical protein